MAKYLLWVILGTTLFSTVYCGGLCKTRCPLGYVCTTDGSGKDDCVPIQFPPMSLTQSVDGGQ